ncbi:MAG: hypothetical protein V7L21_22060 [Nostoc sp.]|uniref:hypothetical protein n=1 Tax=unclassified Nostoc TaxID=2593658 RepID=UPI0025DEB3AE|nr:hypothetical protein [Nostoc sp. NMS9]MBN3941904.1 hypothetical protein [Nostoc sp. NMS9]
MVALLYIQQKLRIEYLSLSIEANQFRDLQKTNYLIVRAQGLALLLWDVFLTASTLNTAGLDIKDIAVLFLSGYRLYLYFDGKSKLAKNKVMQLVNTDMNSCPKILAAIAATFLSLVTIDVNSAQAGNFTFTSIVNDRDNKNFFDVGGGPINDNGTVAFGAFSTGLTLKGKLKQKSTVRINNL